VHREGTSVGYTTERRSPRQRGAALTVKVEPLSFVTPEALTPLERFLTCRWRLYSLAPLELPASHIGLLATQVEHRAWPLWRARSVGLYETLVQTQVSDDRMGRRSLTSRPAWTSGSVLESARSRPMTRSRGDRSR
jgi:uncharacterized protein YqjF (DUF2071 family)